jgi:hypothetical protein
MTRAAFFAILAIGGLGIGAGVAAIAGASGGSPSISWSEATAQVMPGADEPVKVHRTAIVDGGEWRFASHSDASGKVCVSNTVPGEAIGRGCLDTAKAFETSAVLALPGGRQREGLVGQRVLGWHNLWIYGFVRSDVASLELVNMDCSTEAVSFDEQGGFLHVVSLAEITAGLVPFKIRARDGSGNIIHDDNVSMNQPPTAQEAGIAKPAPGLACR